MFTARVIPFALRLRSPMTTANGTETERVGFLVGVGDDSGLWGWGEATPMPPWSTEDAPTTGAVLRRWTEQWTSIDEAADVGLASLGRSAAIDDLRKFPHAASAVSGAIEDLRARQVGCSLAEHLRPSGRPAHHVLVSALVGGATPDLLAVSAVAAAAAGCSTVKIKVAAETPATDVDRVAAVRSAVGSEVRIRVDANGGWDHATAVATLRALEPLDIEMCEEPVSGLDGLAAVRREVGIPVAIDESLTSVDTLDAALALGSADVVICKPQALGGPRRAIDLADRAAEAGLPVVVTSFIDGTIGLVTALHVASLLPSSGPAHGLATSTLLATDNAQPLTIVDGALYLPTGPGIGINPTL